MQLTIQLTHAILMLFGLWYYWKRWAKPSDRIIFPIAVTVKLFACLAIGIVYLKYLDGGDSLIYFQEAEKIAQLSKSHTINFFDVVFETERWSEQKYDIAFSNQPRAFLFLKIIYSLYLFTSGSFWLISVWLTLFSFFCGWWFYLILKRIKIVPHHIAALAILFWPSVVFWSSGIMKESISLGLIFILCGQTLLIGDRKKINIIQIFLLIFLGYFLFKLKYYYAGTLLPLIASYLAVTLILKSNRPHIKWYNQYRLLAFFALFAGLIAFVSHLHPNLHFEQIGKVMIRNYELFEQKSHPEKMVHFENLEPDFLSFLAYSPKALISGWFRPSLLDMENKWSFIAAIENTLLLIFFLFQLKNIKKMLSGDYLLKWSVLIFCVVTGILLSFSAPNFGTLVRYRVGFLPFFILGILNGNYLLEWIKRKLSGVFYTLDNG